MAWPTSPSRNSRAPSSASHSKVSPRSGLRKVSPDLSIARRPARRSSRARGRGEDRRDDGEEISLEHGERESSARGTHRRLDQALDRQPAELLMHCEEAGHNAWRGARANADVELLLGRPEIGVDGIEVDVAGFAPLARRLGEEIEELKRRRCLLAAPSGSRRRPARRTRPRRRRS